MMEPIMVGTMILERTDSECDSASTSTATTEEECSSGESSTKSPPIAVARKKAHVMKVPFQSKEITIQSNQQIQQQLYQHQQQVQHQQVFQQQAYYQAQNTRYQANPMYPTNYYGYPQGPGVMAPLRMPMGKKGYPHGQQQQEPQGSPQIRKKKNRRPNKKKRASMVYGYPHYCTGMVPQSYRGYHKNKLPRTLTKQQQDRYLALDCEMVGVGDNGTHSALARVTLVDWHGNVIMDELVNPQWQVTDYRTFVSGITKELLEHATMNFTTARAKVLDHLRGKILVGHALENDLQVLSISLPWYMIRDTAAYQPYMKTSGCGSFQNGGSSLWPRALKDLCREKLHREVQVVGRPHCPKEDALAALDLYHLVWQQWEESIEYMLQTEYMLQRQSIECMLQQGQYYVHLRAPSKCM